MVQGHEDVPPQHERSKQQPRAGKGWGHMSPSAPQGIPVLAEMKAMKCELRLLADAGPMLPVKRCSCFSRPAQAGLCWVNRRLRRRQARNLDGRLTDLVPAQPQR